MKIKFLGFASGVKFESMEVHADCWEIPLSFVLPVFSLPLDANSHHLAVAYSLQLCDAHLDPGRIEVLEDDLRNVFSQGFQQ
jgi:hypothetical protein